MEVAVASTIPTEQVRNAGAMNFLVERFRPPRHGHTVSSRGVLFARLQGTELQTLALKRAVTIYSKRKISTWSCTRCFRGAGTLNIISTRCLPTAGCKTSLGKNGSPFHRKKRLTAFQLPCTPASDCGSFMRSAAGAVQAR